jgi:hypothetical protein
MVHSQWALAASLLQVWVTVSSVSGAPLVTGMVPTMAVNNGEAPGAVGSTWVTVYWCGGDGRRKVGLGWGKLVMEVTGAAIYMGFGPLSCTTRSRYCIYLQSKFNSLFGWDSEWSP